ncbi:helix-turn-helix domain-containing protein [Virgibacillus halodenitrificans]|nr:helix-turn-helix domain-containing protein [Virgibacillus halodenitrificans]
MGLIHCNLRVLMAERNLNIQKVKDKTTLSRTTISNLYNNYGSGVQFDTLKQLCKLLNCKPGDIFSYYDISVEFEEIAGDDELNSELDLESIYSSYRKDNGIDQSGNKTKIHALCKLEYEGEILEFEFKINLQIRFKNENSMEVEGIISRAYQTKLDSLKMPFHAENFVKEKLDEFIIEWTSKTFDDDLDGWGAIRQEFSINTIQ